MNGGDAKEGAKEDANDNVVVAGPGDGTYGGGVGGAAISSREPAARKFVSHQLGPGKCRLPFVYKTQISRLLYYPFSISPLFLSPSTTNS